MLPRDNDHRPPGPNLVIPGRKLMTKSRKEPEQGVLSEKVLRSRSRLQHDLDAAVLLVAERLVGLGAAWSSGKLVGDHERRVDLAVLDLLQAACGDSAGTWVWPILKVSPLFIAAPMGILSRKPM